MSKFFLNEITDIVRSVRDIGEYEIRLSKILHVADIYICTRCKPRKDFYNFHYLEW